MSDLYVHILPKCMIAYKFLDNKTARVEVNSFFVVFKYK